MSERPGLRPDDLLTAADLAATALMPLADRDWTVNAFELEWSCRHTVGHVLRAFALKNVRSCARASAMQRQRWRAKARLALRAR